MQESYFLSGNEAHLGKTAEVWQQDSQDPDLWHGRHGLIVNTAALLERKFFFDVILAFGENPEAARRLDA